MNSRGPPDGNSAHAARSDPARTPWGVWAVASDVRSIVSTTRPPAIRLTVSATARTGIAAPWAAVAAATVSMRARLTAGRAPSWTRITRSSGASRASNAAATESWRRAPPATTATTHVGSHGAAAVSASRSAATATTTRSIPGAAASASSVHARSGRSPIRAMSLSCPSMRRLAPAATTIASNRSAPFAAARRGRLTSAGEAPFAGDPSPGRPGTVPISRPGAGRRSSDRPRSGGRG